MSTRFSFLGFKSRRISSKVSLTIPHSFLVMFDFMETIALLVFGIMHAASKSDMFLLSTILVLRNTRIHVGSSDSCDLLTYIEVFVNKILSFYTILRILNINSYNSHV